MKKITNFNTCLLTGLIALGFINAFFLDKSRQGQEKIIARLDNPARDTAQPNKDMQYIKDTMTEVYDMKAREEAKAYVMLDNMLRILHHVKAHKGHYHVCHECDDHMRKGLEAPERKNGEKTLWKAALDKMQ